MIRNLLSISFFFISVATLSQRPFAENVWSSMLVNYKDAKWGVTADVGYRSCNQFVQNPRTALFRLTTDRVIIKDHRIGLGYAYFEHYNTTSSYENRWFVQYSKGFEIKNSRLIVRLRNELRTYNNRNTTNRTRIQLTWIKKLSETFRSQFSTELFYTPGQSSLFEQRYTLGLNSSITNHLKLTGFYTLQIQSSINYLQHIIGIQAQLVFQKEQD